MRALGDPREVAGTLHSLAELDRIGGDYAQARKGFEEGLAIGRALGDRRGIAVARHSLAELDRLSGDYAQARKGFEESLAISRALGDRREAAVTLASLADLDRLSGDYAKARKGFAESLVTLRALGDPHVIAVTELYLAAAEAATRPKAGMLHLRELLESVAVLAAPLVRLRGRLLLGEALAGAQQWAEALAEFRPAVAEAEKYGLLALGAQGRGGMADCLANLGHKTAAQVARKALTWFREQAPRHPAVARLESIARSRTTKRSRSA
jgi:tetratricopeptide (TPR) repeat protein